MAQALAVKEKANTVRELLKSRETEFRLALPKHMTVERMMRLALTSCIKTPRLLDCTRESLVGAVLEACQAGLEIDGEGGVLVPFKNNRRGTYEATFMKGYKGLIDLACRSGRVLTVLPMVVYERDEFSFDVMHGPHHIPYDGEEDPGKATRFYALARMENGGVIWSPRPWSMAKVRAHRQKYERNRGGDSSMTDEQYGQKSVIRELCKYLPRSPELQSAIRQDERREAGIDEAIDVSFEHAETEDKPPADKKLEAISGGKAVAKLHDGEKKAIREALAASTADEYGLNKWVKDNYEVGSWEELPAVAYEVVIDWLESQTT